MFRLSPKDKIKKNTEYYYTFVTLKENKKAWEYELVDSFKDNIKALEKQGKSRVFPSNIPKG